MDKISNTQKLIDTYSTSIDSFCSSVESKVDSKEKNVEIIRNKLILKILNINGEVE